MKIIENPLKSPLYSLSKAPHGADGDPTRLHVLRPLLEAHGVHLVVGGQRLSEGRQGG